MRRRGGLQVKVKPFLNHLSYVYIKMETVDHVKQNFSALQRKKFFSLYSGVLDNSGGKILVRKVAGQSGYKGSYSNGVQSLSLPRWRESFIISGKPEHWGNVLLHKGTWVKWPRRMKCVLLNVLLVLIYGPPHFIKVWSISSSDN